MLIVSVDGGCPGVQNVVDGVIGATSQQYPLLMASMGIEAIKKFADTGELPAKTEGKDFTDTGVDADHRQAGRGRPLDRHRRGPGEVLGLIRPAPTDSGRPATGPPSPSGRGAGRGGSRE